MGLTEQERRYVLLHEQAHIRRWDHRFKPLAYALLCLHWFDPILWIAYRAALLGHRDGDGTRPSCAAWITRNTPAPQSTPLPCSI